MIQALVGADPVQAVDRAGLRISGAIHNAADTSIHQRSSTHQARFQRDVERAIIEPPMPDHRSGITQRENFRVGGGVAGELAFVVPTCNDNSIAHDDRANRDIIVSQRGTSFFERDLHEFAVEIHGGQIHGGGGGIRTHGGLHLTRFPSVPIRPLSHPSVPFNRYLHGRATTR